MSFKYKPKLIISDINFEKIYLLYESYIRDPDYEKYLKKLPNNCSECQFCNSTLLLQKDIYGIPLSLKNQNGKILIKGYGSYCSLSCSYKHYCKLNMDSSRKKNVLFTDTGPIFKFLSYHLFKDYNLENHTKEIDLETKNIYYEFTV